MSKFTKIKRIYAGDVMAEIEVEMTDEPESWGPHIEPSEVDRIDGLRKALKSGDLKAASKQAKLYSVKPLAMKEGGHEMQDAEHENPRLHKCAEMPSTGVNVQYGRNLLGRPLCWSLYLIREATEEDLEENHLLEEVGDSIWSVYHEISYCPHCGLQLVKPVGLISDNFSDMDLDQPYGSFSLFDQQKWYGSRR